MAFQDNNTNFTFPFNEQLNSTPLVHPLIQQTNPQTNVNPNPQTNIHPNNIPNRTSSITQQRLLSIDNSIDELSLEIKKERKSRQNRNECCWICLASFVLLNAIGLLVGLLLYYYYLSRKS